MLNVGLDTVDIDHCLLRDSVILIVLESNLVSIFIKLTISVTRCNYLNGNVS